MTVVMTVGSVSEKRFITVDRHSSALQHSLDCDDERIYRTPLTIEQRETPGRNK